jgi:glycyl-tRNA synthetase beta chain
MSKDLLFEIGAEEIPANYMPATLKQVRDISEAMLKNNRIAYEDIKTYGTPRRIVLFIKGIAEQQADLEELVKGPSVKAAYDENGNPSKALLGFLKGQKAELGDVFIKELSGVEYVYYKKQERGKPVKEVLKTLLPDILTSISFPKSMKWGNKSFRFARPVRWLVPILGDELIEFDKDGIQCSRYTKGHRVLSQGNIEIKNASEYFDKLRAGFVIADQEERRSLIRRQCEELAREIGGEVLMDEDLLEEIVYLVEYPTALIGGFEAEYLRLPKEVVITPMKEHQRYFPVVDKSGKLMNHFITVRNGDSRFLETVKEGNEKVLKARLADADFFYREDRKESLDNYVEKLKNAVFQETLGTIYDKTQRIAATAEYLAVVSGLSEDGKKNLLRAAHLCKADLVTNMVKEFDELQGIMGKEYALLQGEDKEVAEAIFEHYLPRFAGDCTPETLIGSILSISDKMDTICGCFAIGIQPTGSQDPYALRRQAIGVTAIILDNSVFLGLSDLIETSLKPFALKGILKGDERSIKRDIIEFFRQRFKNVMIDRGFEYDIIDAVINAGFDDIYDSYLKIRELSKWKNRDEFLSILSSFNRVSNLASKAKSPEINESLFTEKAELELLHAFGKVNAEFEDCVNNREYEKALKLMITLKKPIDDFFDSIMVMVEDEGIRNNRLGLLKSIENMMIKIADLSVVVVNKIS